MSARAEDRLSLPVKWPVLVAVCAGLVLLVGGLAIADRARARRQLAALAAEFCDVELPAGLLAKIDRLAASGTPEKTLAEAVGEQLATLPFPGSIHIYYNSDARLWRLSEYYGAQAVTASEIPAAFGGWAETWTGPQCRSVQNGKYLVGGRRLSTPGGSAVLAVLTRQRASDFFD